MTTTSTSPHRVVTVSRYGVACPHPGDPRVPLWTVAIYEARPRKADGVWVWRRVNTVGALCEGAAPSEELLAAAREYAAEHGLPVAADVRRNRLALDAMPPAAQVAYHLGARDLRGA